jgi:hypothetical protein
VPAQAPGAEAKMTNRLPAAVLLSALSLAWPALAQTGARVSPTRPEASRPQSSALADSVEDPATLMRLASSALENRRMGEATELLERAESRLLTRSELASEADRPAVGGTIGDLAAARDAISRRDAAGAQGLIASAIRRVESGQPPAVAALPSAPSPTRPVAPSSMTGMTVTPAPVPDGGGATSATTPLPGIAPQNMPVGGTASPPVPLGPDQDYQKAAPLPGSIPPTSTKPPPLQ